MLLINMYRQDDTDTVHYPPCFGFCGLVVDNRTGKASGWDMGSDQEFGLLAAHLIRVFRSATPIFVGYCVPINQGQTIQLVIIGRQLIFRVAISEAPLRASLDNGLNMCTEVDDFTLASLPDAPVTRLDVQKHR